MQRSKIISTNADLLTAQERANKDKEKAKVVLKEILEDIYYGQWEDAQVKYKDFPYSPGMFMHITRDLSEQQMRSLIILGFYSRGASCK